MPQVKNPAEKVRLVSVPTDKYKTACISVSAALPMSGNLAANALLVYLLKRSCKKYPEFSLLSGRLDELYGAYLAASVSKNGEAQVLTLGITGLADRFALDENESIARECAGLLAELIFNPNCNGEKFNEDAVALEKRLLIQRVEEEIDDKRTYALNRCISFMCENELYGKGRFGTVEEIEAVTAEDVFKAWKNLLETAIIQITVVGSADYGEISRIFSEKFADIQRNPVEINTVFVPECAESRRFEEKFPVNQGKLVMGFRAGTHRKDEDFAAYTVMNDIFGMGTYSKLFTNVREKLSLAYYCFSRFASSKGIVTVESGIDTDKEEAVTKEVLAQLEDLKNGNTAHETLESSKKALRERYTFSSPESFVAWYTSQLLYDELLTPEEMIEKTEKVTMDEVCAAAKKLSLDTVYMLSAEEEKNDED